MVALVALVAGGLGSTSQAQQTRSANAVLRIQVNVIPTLIAAQQAEKRAAVPAAQAPVTYILKSEGENSGTYSTRDLAGDTSTQQPAVLKTMTIVAN